MAIPGLYDCFAHWAEQGTVWLYSDTHFGDKELRSVIKTRPSDAVQIARINEKVGKKDTLILLGDVGDLSCAKQLRGRKVLIAGNHDTGLSAYKEVFDEVYSGPLIIGEKLILSHEPIMGITWAMNFHGHIHNKRAKTGPRHINFCADIIDYTPVNMNQLMKSGPCAKIISIHRTTIDKATARKNSRHLN